MKISIGKYHKNSAPRKIRIRVDPWDTYNADDTLALVILPVLQQFRADNKGCPFVDDEDVPENLYVPKTFVNNDQEHELWVARWDYVLGEMINAFDRIIHDDWEEDFYEGEVFHGEACKAEHKRIDNGLRLFGKYFRGLWT